jgi:hypothetical protein
MSHGSTAMRKQALKDLIDLERAAKAELQRRTIAAQAQILQLLHQHRHDLSARQLAVIKRCLR